ncbi:hypothetical protein [Mycolicibacterium vaccae]|uniref:hypothetical protein n=1 Tax=Mycolicibacterium vaccae TaxID=1810 RepID=UPI003D088B66
MTDVGVDPTRSDRALSAIRQRAKHAATSAEKLYELIRAAHDLGYGLEELQEATSMERRALQAIVAGDQPPLAVGHADSEPKDEQLTLAVVEDLKRKGFNQSEIARMYGVTRQYVSWIKHTYGGSLTPRESVLKTFPWSVPEKMTQSVIYKRLRDHGEYMATGGAGMSDDKLMRLRSFYRKLRSDDVVVEFDPSNPPEPGVSLVGGFAYRPRTRGDGQLLIRVNAEIELSDEQKSIWRFPDIEP